MTYTRIIALGLMLASLSTVEARAQNLGPNPAPAEFPPASFNGNQYVDSRGCVFIRAGIDGNVTWVPRVTRNRQQVCGAQPSLARSASAPAAPRQTAAAPVQIVPRAPQPAAAAPRQPATTTTRQPMPTVATTVTRKPQPTAKPRVATTPAAAPVPRQAPRPSPAPKPTVVSPAPKPAAPAPAPAVRSGGSKCSNASAFSQRYINDGSKFPVRCGPQSESPVTRPSDRSSEGRGGGGERILPSHLVDERRQASIVVVPEGYEPVWTDGRLNPKRAEQSVDGYVVTQYGWTNTVPRRGATKPKVKQPKIVSDRPVSTQAYRPVIVEKPAAAPVRQAAKATRPSSAATAGIYVQVGMYAVEQNARASAQRMARTGFPTRMGTLTRGGSSYRLVMAGPFASRAEAGQALKAARQAGFNDAYIRN